MQRQSFKRSTIDLSPEIHTLAKQAELGELYKVYPVSKEFTSIWALGQMCIAHGVIILMISIILIILRSLGLIVSTPESLLFILGLLLSGLLLLIAGYYTNSQETYAHWQVDLWQYGFIYEKKRVRQVFRWDQIENIHSSVTQIPTRESSIAYTCKVCHQNGYEVTLRSIFSDAPELIDIILEESAYHLAPQDLRIPSPRNISTFANLKLDREGIGNAQETLPWSEVQEFITKNGEVTLRKKEE